MTVYRRAPQGLTGTLAELQQTWVPETLLAEIQRAWPDTVGQAIAAEARPVSERGGVLTVGCSSAAWANELSLMAPAILDRLNDRLRTGRIARLRCTAAV